MKKKVSFATKNEKVGHFEDWSADLKVPVFCTIIGALWIFLMLKFIPWDKITGNDISFYFLIGVAIAIPLGMIVLGLFLGIRNVIDEVRTINERYSYIYEKDNNREIKPMNNQEVVKELFNDIKVSKEESQVTFEDVDKRALKQWTEKHDRIPTIDDIDLVIKEVRNER